VFAALDCHQADMYDFDIYIYNNNKNNNNNNNDDDNNNNDNNFT